MSSVFKYSRLVRWNTTRHDKFAHSSFPSVVLKSSFRVIQCWLNAAADTGWTDDQLLENFRLTWNQNNYCSTSWVTYAGPDESSPHFCLFFNDTFQCYPHKYLGLPSRLYLPRFPADFLLYMSHFSHAVPISSTAIGHPINILNGPNRACYCKTWWRNTVVLGWKKVGLRK